MTTFLTVPFAEKDQAKSLGARWNADKKKWYVPAGVDLTPFKKWATITAAEIDNVVTSNGAAAAPSMEEIGLTITGDKYVERALDCIPWMPCAECDA